MLQSAVELEGVCVVCVQIESSVGEDQCYEVQSQGLRDQVLEVLTAFNVHVTQDDIFSRCQVCPANWNNIHLWNSSLRVCLCWSLCTFCVFPCQVRVTVGDLGLGAFVRCLSSTNCWFIVVVFVLWL